MNDRAIGGLDIATTDDRVPLIMNDRQTLAIYTSIDQSLSLLNFQIDRHDLFSVRASRWPRGKLFRFRVIYS